MDKTRIAWAAGFVDGEGCITISTRVRSRNRRDYGLSLYVGQVDPKPLLMLREMFGGSVVRKSRQKFERRQMWMWRLTGRSAYAALLVIRPYLVVKADQADIAVEFQERMSSYVRVGRRVDDAETEARMAMLAALKAAKWRTFEDPAA